MPEFLEAWPARGDMPSALLLTRFALTLADHVEEAVGGMVEGGMVAGEPEEWPAMGELLKFLAGAGVSERLSRSRMALNPSDDYHAVLGHAAEFIDELRGMIVPPP